MNTGRIRHGQAAGRYLHTKGWPCESSRNRCLRKGRTLSFLAELGYGFHRTFGAVAIADAHQRRQGVVRRMPPVLEADSLAHATLNLHRHCFHILVIAALMAGLFAL